MKKELILIFLMITVFAPTVLSEATQVISNSENWRDVYSSILYGNLEGKNADFLVSTAHGPILLNGINKQNEILVVTSEESPFVFNYGDYIEAQGFAGAEEITTDSANLELIERLPEINNFVIIGDYYGYNAIAVQPYAMQKRSWVFIANRENIEEIDAILSDRNIGEIILYGYVDREVKDTIQKYNPKIINNGDRFEDNVKIVEEYLKLYSTTQVLLTNGEFIEKELMTGLSPVLFTGKENVPEQIKQYLKGSDMTVAVLIGNELINAATNIRRDTGISVMVKFARSARSQQGGIAAVENLDLFPLPSPSLMLEIYSIKYNKALNQIEVTYKSKSNVPAYLKGTLTITADGERQRIGDVDAIFIAPNDYKTIIYSGINLNTDEGIKAEVYTLFGETATSFDRILQGNFDVSYVDILDSSTIEICDSCVEYNLPKEGFFIEVKNVGPSGVWVDLEIVDVMINGVKRTIGASEPVYLERKKSKKVFIDQLMDEQDLKDNQYIIVNAFYGQKEDSLVKLLKGKFLLEITRYNIIIYAIIILLIIILFLIWLIWRIKKREEEDF